MQDKSYFQSLKNNLIKKGKISYEKEINDDSRTYTC
jgi:hypothetical protein